MVCQLLLDVFYVVDRSITSMNSSSGNHDHHFSKDKVETHEGTRLPKDTD